MADDNVPLRLSHSAVEDYSQCGEKYRLRRVVKVPQAPSWALVGGSAFHQVTEHLDLMEFGYDDGGTGDFAEALDAEERKRVEETGILPDQWTASGRASKEWPEKENREWWEKHGPEMVRTYQRFKLSSPWQVWITPDATPAVELELEWEVGGVKVKGYLDRIWENVQTGALAIVDLKTGSREPMGVKQLVTYHNALTALWDAEQWQGYPPVWGAYYMARTGLLTAPVNVDELDDGRIEYDYQAAYWGIENGVFLPSKSMLCSSCDVRKYCREFGGELAGQELPYERS